MGRAKLDTTPLFNFPGTDREDMGRSKYNPHLPFLGSGNDAGPQG